MCRNERNSSRLTQLPRNSSASALKSEIKRGGTCRGTPKLNHRRNHRFFLIRSRSLTTHRARGQGKKEEENSVQIDRTSPEYQNETSLRQRDFWIQTDRACVRSHSPDLLILPMVSETTRCSQPIASQALEGASCLQFSPATSIPDQTVNPPWNCVVSILSDDQRPTTQRPTTPSRIPIRSTKELRSNSSGSVRGQKFLRYSPPFLSLSLFLPHPTMCLYTVFTIFADELGSWWLVAHGHTVHSPGLRRCK